MKNLMNDPYHLKLAQMSTRAHINRLKKMFQEETSWQEKQLIASLFARAHRDYWNLCRQFNKLIQEAA